MPTPASDAADDEATAAAARALVAELGRRAWPSPGKHAAALAFLAMEARDRGALRRAAALASAGAARLAAAAAAAARAERPPGASGADGASPASDAAAAAACELLDAQMSELALGPRAGLAVALRHLSAAGIIPGALAAAAAAAADAGEQGGESEGEEEDTAADAAAAAAAAPPPPQELELERLALVLAAVRSAFLAGALGTARRLARRAAAPAIAARAASAANAAGPPPLPPPPPLSRTPIRNEAAYYGCVSRLLLLWPPPPPPPPSPPPLAATAPALPRLLASPLMPVVGDSHVLPLAWRALQPHRSQAAATAATAAAPAAPAPAAAAATFAAPLPPVLAVPFLIEGLKLWHLRPGAAPTAQSAAWRLALRRAAAAAAGPLQPPGRAPLSPPPSQPPPPSSSSFLPRPLPRLLMVVAGEIDAREGLARSVASGRQPSVEAAAEGAAAALAAALGVGGSGGGRGGGGGQELLAAAFDAIVVHPVPPLREESQAEVAALNAALGRVFLSRGGSGRGAPAQGAAEAAAAAAGQQQQQQRRRRRPVVLWLDPRDVFGGDGGPELDLDGTHLSPAYLPRLERALGLALAAEGW